MSATAPDAVFHPASLSHLADGSKRLGTASVGGPAVFLHTGWRSAGTWIWSLCRELPRVHAYYEPLHEHVARFRRRDLASMRPGSWQSNHSETAPYFEEYRDLIPPGGRGVALYQERFAFDGFFRAPDDPADPELLAYLRSLLLGPMAAGRVPVLKFCRSLGRVGWLEQLFPQALHAVVLRDPVSQFQSTQLLLLEQRNRYFALAPMLVLARNAQHAAVREAAAALGVILPVLHSPDLDYAVEKTWRHVRRASPEERYRGFLAFWTLCAISALDSEAMVIDVDAVATDAVHRDTAESALSATIGEPISLKPRRSFGRSVQPPGREAVHRAAAELVLAQHHRLTPKRMETILAKLKSDEPPTGAVGWRAPALPPVPSQRTLNQLLTTWFAVRLARALQPLRRLHGTLVWRAKIFPRAS